MRSPGAADSRRFILLTLREMAQSGHLYEPPRPARTRPARGQSAPRRTRGPSILYALHAGEWDFLRTWTEPEGFPELKLTAPLLLLCQQLIPNLKNREPATAMQSLQIREAIAGTLHELRRQGLAGQFGLRSSMIGDHLVSTLAERLPKAIASL